MDTNRWSSPSIRSKEISCATAIPSLTFWLSRYCSIANSALIPLIHFFTMRSPTCLFACVLGLLPSLSMAVQPIFSTVPPFTLNIGRFEPLLYNVTLKYLGDDIQAFVPVLTKGPTTEFKIVNGNLTTSDSSLGAYFGNTTATGLRPILFSDKVPTGVFVETADFVENTIFSPSAGYIPKIFSLNGGEFDNPSERAS